MTSDNYNQELTELLSAYLDNELTELQVEKVEQLLESDQQARELLEMLQDASSVVSSLPKEKLARSLTDEVLYVLERDSLLDGNDDMAIMAGERHLRFRHFVGVAAILLLVAGVFSVVYSVLKPGTVQETEQTLAVADIDNSAIQKRKMAAPTPTAKGVVEFDSIKDAANFLTGKSNPDSELLSDEISQSEPVTIIDEPLPKLPPLKKLAMPKPLWSSVKLISSISSNETIMVERLKNLVSRYGDGSLAVENDGFYTFAFVCRKAELEEFAMALRDSLPGEINVQINNVGIYQQVDIKSVSSDELIELASLAEPADQLSYCQLAITADRVICQEKKTEIDPLLWYQLADIIPGQYQDKFADSMKLIFEPLEINSSMPVELAAALGANILEPLETSSEPVSRGIANISQQEQNKKMLVKAARAAVEDMQDLEIVPDSQLQKGKRGFSSQLIANKIETSKITDQPVRSLSAAKSISKKYADFIAIEIILNLDSSQSQQGESDSPQSPEPPAEMKRSDNSVETRINFGSSGR